MRTFAAWGVLAISGLLPLAAQTPSTITLPASANTALTGAIMQRLTDDPVLRGITITANVGAGNTVSLNGVVPTQAQADRAVAVVAGVPGVTKVTSQILVNVDPFSPPRRAPKTAPPLDAAPPPPPAATEPLALIADALGKVAALSRVGVQVQGQDVTLLGTVEQKAESTRAEAIVRKVLPHAVITNVISVDPHPIAPPPKIPHAGAGS